MDVSRPLNTFVFRTAAAHVATYFLAGLIAAPLLDYKTAFDTGPLSGILRPFASPWIAAGPALNVFRGVMFGLILFPYRRVFLEEAHGTWKLWALVAGLAILGTCAAAPGSLEGIIFTRLPLMEHISSYPEIMVQTLAFSAILTGWYRRPGKAWNAVAAAALIAVLLSLMGAVMPRPEPYR